MAGKTAPASGLTPDAEHNAIVQRSRGRTHKPATMAPQSAAASEIPDCASNNEPACEPPSETQTDSDWFRRDYDVALLMLSREQRMVIHLALQLGFTQSEVADVMGLPLGTVKSNLQRGRLRLATLLAKWEGVHFDAT